MATNIDNRKCPFIGGAGPCIHTAGWNADAPAPNPRPFLDPDSENYPWDVCFGWDIENSRCRFVNVVNTLSKLDEMQTKIEDINTTMQGESKGNVAGNLVLESVTLQDQDHNNLIYGKDFKVKTGDGHPEIPPMIIPTNDNLPDDEFSIIYFMDEIPGVIFP